MTDHDGPQRSRATSFPEAIDRRGRDGAAGDGDMLGGLGAGAGDRLGPDEAFDEPAETRRRASNQHSFADAEFEIDAADNYRGADKLS